MSKIDLSVLKSALDFYKIGFSLMQKNQFTRFYDFLLVSNRRHNLISSQDEQRLVIRHFVDSLLLFGIPDFLPRKIFHILDAGSGAGFPGIPLKICLPEIPMMLLDAQRKRVAFLKNAVRKLELSEVEIVHSRLECPRFQSDFAGNFDLIVSRAVENFDLILKNCLPLLTPDGILLLYKGGCVEKELETVDQIISSAFTYVVIKPHLPPNFPYQRLFFVVRKNSLSI
ncbi:MAG: 16S rRNA (guanine(527)-N(7))-methyltransferase RsmG [Candidatus Cloacimonetes bacterium 4572_55]|nr:MAG: 16S rRNA (guanine(527)-N(7))-methyltransferase RsmG [Candidatus Cloacimonetes bacterium 4572_55]